MIKKIIITGIGVFSIFSVTNILPADSQPQKKPKVTPAKNSKVNAAKKPKAKTAKNSKVNSAKNALVRPQVRPDRPDPNPNPEQFPIPPFRPLNPKQFLPANCRELPSPDGRSVCKYNEGTYKGYLNAKGLPNGKGVFVLGTSEYYEGEFKNGVFIKGIVRLANDDRYIGTFVNGFPEGNGTYYYSNGDKFECQNRIKCRITRNKVDGRAGYYFANGDYFQGQFIQGEIKGQGVFVFANGTVCKGDFHSSDFLGTGKCFYPDKSVYEGEFRNGSPHGKGILTYASGDKDEGEFRGGRYIGKFPKNNGAFQPPDEDKNKR